MNLTSSQWADIILVGFLLLSVVIGYIKGFFRSIIGFVVAGLAAFAGYLLAPKFVTPVTEWIYPKAKNYLLQIAEKKLTLPEDLELTEEQIATILKPMIDPVSKVLLWIVIGLVCAVILSIIGTIIAKKLDNNEVLKKADRRFGAVLGFIESFVICLVLLIVVAKIGLADNLYNALDKSVMIKLYSSFVPADMESLIINVPIVGSVDLKELFSSIELPFLK